jgi:hypothetical protein
MPGARREKEHSEIFFNDHMTEVHAKKTKTEQEK